MGTSKMNQRDWELLDKQMRRLTPPHHEGVIALMLAMMFLVGITLGSVLSPHQSAPTTDKLKSIAKFERERGLNTHTLE